MREPETLVFVVDDDDSVRRALARLIRSAGHSVEVFASAREFLGEVDVDARPACLVLDVQLPDLDGLQLQHQIDATLPIIFLTGHGDIGMTVRAMKAGATDFLTKPVCDEDLLRAIEFALESAKQRFASRCERDTVRQRYNRLTPREREVMALVVTGRLNKQVAGELGTAEKTIKAHRAQVMTKMEVTSLAQLIHIIDRVDVLSDGDNRPSA
ncbi:response regulator [Paraburkholderia fungorum]|uniref:response regulator transcription factor n=1 Tax=Paraburkholderia fungorum TaxID=134537 RepID=UPI0038BA3FFB